MAAERKNIGWFPNAMQFLWAGLAGVIASLVIGVPMMMMGALEDMVAALVGAPGNLAVGWLLHLAAGFVFGGAFGLFVVTGNVWKGMAYGLAWGIIVGVLFAWLAVFALLGLPIDPSMTAAQNDVALHLLWGVIVGGGYAFALHRTEARPAAERRGRARAV